MAHRTPTPLLLLLFLLVAVAASGEEGAGSSSARDGGGRDAGATRGPASVAGGGRGVAGQKNPTPPYNVPKAWCLENNSLEDRADAGQAARPLVPSNMKAALVTRPKKRKFTERALVSWHKITEGTQKLRKTSTNEMDWAWAANRLIKKSEDDPENLEDAPVTYLPRKRLIMTTKLIQEVFSAIPARVLRAQAVSAYESATYNIAMVTLGDTCIISSDNSRALADNENNPSEQRTSAKQMEDKLSKVVEVFVGRIRKMENDYLRYHQTQ
ncbi:hypothetical protein ZWY2020_023682 [Hordeum vulgare]|nr:hypothetical protein ZWY2020_023682 [Hordeum vulgare]